MEKTFKVQLLDPSKAIQVSPDKLTVWIPSPLPDEEFVKIAVEVEQNETVNDLPRNSKIYREVMLPRQSVRDCFEAGEDLTWVLNEEKVSNLIALFGYTIAL